MLCLVDTPFSKVKLGEMTKFLARQDYNPISLTRAVSRGMLKSDPLIRD